MGLIAFLHPAGVIAAAVVPFNEDFLLDEAACRLHYRDIARTAGLSGMAQAGEHETLSFEEDERVLSLMVEEVGDRLPVVATIYGEGLEAASVARMATRVGVSALMVCPPPHLRMGGQMRPEIAYRNLATIADASPLPIILYQFPAATGLGYAFDTVIDLVDRVPTISALKDWGNDPALHQRLIHALQSRSKPINVLSAHSAWLMASLAMGCNGLCSSVGSIICDLQYQLFQAIQTEDLSRARAINRRVMPITDALYEPPTLELHNRTKHALMLTGRLRNAVVRPPLAPLSLPEIGRLRDGLRAAGLLEKETPPADASRLLSF
jgi:4-hydroxy-tetrahydrodipicolinate synthase